MCGAVSAAVESQRVPISPRFSCSEQPRQPPWVLKLRWTNDRQDKTVSLWVCQETVTEQPLKFSYDSSEKCFTSLMNVFQTHTNVTKIPVIQAFLVKTTVQTMTFWDHLVHFAVFSHWPIHNKALALLINLSSLDLFISIWSSEISQPASWANNWFTGKCRKNRKLSSEEVFPLEWSRGSSATFSRTSVDRI